MPKFIIMLYLVPNLAPRIAFVKFGIALENAFYVKMLNFGIGTQIWYYVGDVIRVENVIVGRLFEGCLID